MTMPPARTAGAQELRRGSFAHDRVRSERAKARPRGNRCPRTAREGAGPGWFVSTLNDLAVILTRALSEQKPVTLRRAESQALERLLEPRPDRFARAVGKTQAI